MILFRRLRPKPYQWRVDAPDEPDTKWVHFNGEFTAQYMMKAAAEIRADVDRMLMDNIGLVAPVRAGLDVEALNNVRPGAVIPVNNVGNIDMIIMDDIENDPIEEL